MTTATVEAIGPELLAGALRPLAELPQWVGWRYQQRGGKQTKAPLNPHTGRLASSTNPATWGTIEQALDFAMRRSAAGVGFVFSSGDELAGVDLDDCIDDEGRLAPEAEAIIKRLASYTEISPSGRGVKLFLRGALPEGGGNRKKVAGFGEVEMYDRGRFFTVTGNTLPEAPLAIADRRAELLELHAEIFGTAPASDAGAAHVELPEGFHEQGGIFTPGAEPTAQRAPGEGGIDDDDELLNKAMKAQGGEKCRRLWEGDASAQTSRSEADLALCNRLAFWTVRRAEQMDRLFRRSGLMRPKWDERHGTQTYGAITIAKAIRDCRETYSGPMRSKRAATANGAAESGGGKGKGAKRARVRSGGATMADRLVELASDVELFTARDGQAFARIAVNGHVECCAVRGKRFKTWLGHAFYRASRKAPGATAIADALNVLEGRAQCEGEHRDVALRIGAADGATWIDLGDESWQAVELRPAGWRMVESRAVPVRFWRSANVRPLPTPVAGGSIDELRGFINVHRDEDWRLLVAWMTAAMRPRGPYPILLVTGEQGAAKSTLCRIVRSIIDPNAAPIRLAPRRDTDLIVAARNGWCIALDNLSGLPRELADAACVLATGAGYGGRALYTDGDEAVFEGARPIMLNGIEDLVGREDLLDRSVALRLAAIDGAARRTEESLFGALDAARPRIVGALLDLVCSAMRELPEVRLEEMPRMADFARWCAALERALYWQPGAILEAYDRNRLAVGAASREANPVARAIMTFVPVGAEWTGTASELLDGLQERWPNQRWPANASALAQAVNRAAPLLRLDGVEVELLGPQGRDRTRRLQIRRPTPPI